MPHSLSHRIPPVLGLAALVLVPACAQTGTSASSDDYPSEPIELIVGYEAGGPTDAGARLLAKELEEKLDTTITVVNRPAANSQVAYTALANAEPDGYTMAATTFPSAIVTVLDESRDASYDRDSFAPAALQVVDPTAVAVAPDSSIETPEDLVSSAKESPGELRATTTGVASNEHFALARLEKVSGADLAPVHFADGSTAATTAFLGGDADVLLANVSDLQPLAESGKARIVGVMADDRSSFVPDVPTFDEAGYDVQISSSRGYVFPSGTPDDVVDEVSSAIGDIMAESSFRQKMKDLGLAPTYMDHTEYAQYWDETEDLFSDLMPLIREEQG